MQLSKIEQQLNEAIPDLEEDFIELNHETHALKQSCSYVEKKVTLCENTIKITNKKLNELERFIRKHNIATAGIPYNNNEDCITLSKDIE